MEEHYSGVELFYVGNSMGKVWYVERYEGTERLPVNYELELAYNGAGRTVLIPQKDLPDLVKALEKATDFMEHCKAADLLRTPLNP